MAEVVYFLCAATCLACMLLLGRGYLRSRQRLLLWSTACFACLLLNNVATIVDLLVVPDVELHWLRSSLALTGVGLLAIGLIWEEA